MQEFDIEAITGGDYYCCDYVDDLESIKFAVIKKLGYPKSAVKWGAAFGRWDDVEWKECREMPHKHRLHPEEGPDYCVHGIVTGGTWELGDAGIVSNGSSKRAICIFVHQEGDETVCVDTHEIGACPNMQYHANLFKKYIFKVSAVAYVSFEGLDEDGIAGKYLERKLRDEVEVAIDSCIEDMRGEVEWEIDHDDFELETSGPNVVVTSVKRLPRS